MKLERSSPEERLRRRQIGGLTIILAIIVAGSIFHAGISRAFPPGWWRIL